MAGLHNHDNEIVLKVAALVKDVNPVAPAAGAAPTKEEYDALVAEFNKLVTALKSKDAKAKP